MKRIGQQFGNYRLIRLLGEGGFAQVFLAEHQHLGIQAAIKVLDTHLSDTDLQDFLQEARTIARLSHPHILRVKEYGVQEDVPFLVMDYAPNGTLRQRHPKGVPIPLVTVLPYIQQVTSALDYAHTQKLIHRDIKPENLLLNRQGDVLLSDFGLAITLHSSHSQALQEVAGTIAYMAPEQLQGKPHLASDQYALGVTLYEWLTGERPFQGSYAAIAMQHMLTPPSPPRDKVPSISPSVEEVILKALAKDPGARFSSIKAFALALEQTNAVQGLSFNPPLAPPTNVIERAFKGQPPSHPLVSKVQSPKETLTQQSLILSSSASTPTIPVTMPTEFIPPGDSRVAVQRRRISRRTMLALLAGTLGVFGGGGGLAWWLHQKHVVSFPPSPPRTPLTIIYAYRGHTAEVNSVSWSPDGMRIASCSNDATVQIWDARNGGDSFIFSGHGGAVKAVAWAPDGGRVASASKDKTVQIWDPTLSGKPLIYTGHSDVVTCIAWSPDGQFLASGGNDQTVQVWDAHTLEQKFIYHTGMVIALAWSPDKKYLALSTADTIVQLLDTSGNPGLTFPTETRALAWSPTSKRFATALIEVQEWDPATGALLFTYRGHTAQILTLAWSPNGKQMVSAGQPSSSLDSLQVWDAESGKPFFTYHNHTAQVNAVAWSPDGTMIASASDDRTVLIWRLS